MAPKALDGIRVVDLSTGIAGPMAAMLLADFGADVVKVEGPGGDPGRTRPGFALWNRNKRGLVVDPATEARLGALLAAADVCLVGGSDGPAPGPSAEAACAANPGLVYVSVPPYLGETPWAGGAESPELLAARTGVTMRQNTVTGGPVDPVFPAWSYVHAVWVAAATAAALVERTRSGFGQQVTVSGVHGTLVLSTHVLVIDRRNGEASPPTGLGGPNATYSRYQCRDGGWLFLAALTPKFQRAALAALHVEDILDDPRTGGELEAFLQPGNRAWIRERIAARFALRDRQEWLDLLRETGVPAGPLLDRAGWLSSPEVESIGMRAELTDPAWGQVVMPGNPVIMARTPATVSRPAPALGEHSASAGWPDVRPVPGGAAPAGNGPLSGVRVLDLGAVLAGPYAGTLLAELGADVIKVEIPAGDSFRGRGMPYIRGQRGLAIDMTSEEGRAAFYSLVKTADLVLDNYRDGVLARLKADYADLRPFNPRVISLSINSFGPGSAFAKEPAFDGVLQSRSGMFTAQGGAGEPVMISVPIIDCTSAALAVLAATVTLFHQRVTGQGQKAYVTMAGAATLAQSEELIQAPGRAAPRIGGRDFRGPGPFDRYYEASDGWLRIQAAPDTAPGRIAAAGIVDGPLPEGAADADWSSLLESAFAQAKRDEAVRALNEAGVAAVPARQLGEVADDPEFRREQIFTDLERGEHDPVAAPHRYARFSRTERTGILTPPGVGEHTTEILREAGLSEETIAQLTASGKVAQGEKFVHHNFAAYR